MSSTSAAGASMITLQFSLEIDLAVAEQEVNRQLWRQEISFLAICPRRPTYHKVNPADAPILTLAITSESMTLPVVHDLVDTRMAQKIAQVPRCRNGLDCRRTAFCDSRAGKSERARVHGTEPGKRTHGNLLRRTSINPRVRSMVKTRAVLLDANDQLKSADEYRRLILAYRPTGPIRLADVATITDGSENRRLAAWSGVTPGVLLNIQRQPGANVIEVVDRVKALLPQLKASLPAGLDVAV